MSGVKHPAHFFRRTLQRGNDLSYEGLDVPTFPKSLWAMVFAMVINYYGKVVPLAPISNSTPAKYTRNAEIRTRYKRGEVRATLAQVFGIPEQRVWQIVQVTSSSLTYMNSSRLQANLSARTRLRTSPTELCSYPW